MLRSPDSGLRPIENLMKDATLFGFPDLLKFSDKAIWDFI